MTDKHKDALVLYRQYRALMSQERDSSNAIDRFKHNRTSAQTHKQQIDRIMTLLPQNSASQPEQARAPRAEWFSWLRGGPLLHYAVPTICAIGVFAALVNHKPYSWTSLIPASVVETSMSKSISDSIGGSAQMSFSVQGNVLGDHYSLGKASTQLALSMALKNESVLPYFVASFKRMEAGIVSPGISDKVSSLAELIANKSKDRTIGDSISQLKLAVQRESNLPVDGFALGQQIESLRVSLLIAERQGDLAALQEVRASIYALSIDQWHSAEVPALNRILIRIHDLCEGSLSLTERRQLNSLILQLDILLT